MKIYLVGGAVRDELLGLAVKDRDYVVVGATPEEMIAQGYRPVGQGFPVFLHPDTKEEYALARTERKSGRGYKGFTFYAAPEVTLEEDLARRDVTINAMAKDVISGELVDPFSGRPDLQQRQLRHVSPAFIEDPLRVLRVARFCARLSDFHVVPETLALMRNLVANGEMQELVPERIWQEIARGLMERAPQRMVDVLQDCGAWQVLVGEDATAPILAALSRSAAAGYDLPVRYGVLCAYLSDGGEDAHRRWKVPATCSDLAQLFRRQRQILARLPHLSAEELVDFLERCDVLRRPARFESLVQLWSSIASPLTAAELLRVRTAIGVIKALDVEKVLAAHPHVTPAVAIHQARVAAVRNLSP